jgi:heme-degrading monooxygenase HmoA
MFSVIFIVQPKTGLVDQYLGLAKLLKPEIEGIDGFLDNERFASRRNKAQILSLSTWRDEKAVIRWRTLAIHYKAQEKGRFELFQHYHLRVGEITADTHIPTGEVLREQRFDTTETGPATVATISELTSSADGMPDSGDLAADLGLPEVGSDGLVDQAVFDSIYNPGKLLLLAAWRNASAAERWKPSSGPVELRHRRVRIVRDYGMADRREAPQYYPPVMAN